MSFFGLFGSAPKPSSKQYKIKIYKDETCKEYFDKLMIEDNTQCYKILDQIDTQFQQGDDVRKILLLTTCLKEKKLITQRILNKQEQIIKIMRTTPAQLEQYVIYKEIKLPQLLEIQQYHHKTWNHNIQNIKEHSYRQGTLLKKNKNNQFRERLFKLQKDTLIFEKSEKNKPIKKSCISLDSMEIEKPQEKSLVFLIKCDQKVYYIKAQSRTDYDGWIYSLHNQIIKWKEVKLLLDYDKKIENFALQKVEKLKTISGQQKSVKQLLQINNYITSQFEKFLATQSNQLDIELFQFLKLCSEVDQLQQQGSQQAKLMIEQRDQLLIKLQQKIYEHSYFQGFENKQLNPTKQEIIRYFDENLLPIFQKTTDQHQLLLDYSIHQYKQHMRFPLPDSSSFYQDPLLDDANQSTPIKQISQE